MHRSVNVSYTRCLTQVSVLNQWTQFIMCALFWRWLTFSLSVPCCWYPCFFLLLHYNLNKFPSTCFQKDIIYMCREEKLSNSLLVLGMVIQCTIKIHYRHYFLSLLHPKLSGNWTSGPDVLCLRFMKIYFLNVLFKFAICCHGVGWL